MKPTSHASGATCSHCDSSAGSRVDFRVEPPERRRKGGPSHIACGCSCCCCCCCLHSIGGLVGAVTAAPGTTVSRMYWKTVGVLIVLALVGGVFADLIISLLALALLMPGLQLLASALVFVRVLSGSENRSAELAALGKITLYAFLGALVGVLMMVGGGSLIAF